MDATSQNPLERQMGSPPPPPPPLITVHIPANWNWYEACRAIQQYELMWKPQLAAQIPPARSTTIFIRGIFST
jgi:hypothetical protein